MSDVYIYMNAAGYPLGIQCGRYIVWLSLVWVVENYIYNVLLVKNVDYIYNVLSGKNVISISLKYTLYMHMGVMTILNYSNKWQPYNVSTTLDP
jgi:hypothetical protein